MKTYWVYILASRTRALYVGMTNDLERRLYEHRNGLGREHAFRYREVKLVWCEVFSNVNDAIANEKRIKSWRREKKIRLIENRNPEWRDLAGMSSRA
ncbi:MAG TPA: GIY-YIG nuclease family protein [Thermoanaerobaculia bacterium]|nr:GIY-YIG nuclease family protein [Thermoanaerobaculia bacterium]